MFVYKNIISKANQVNMQEVEKIESYINEIYLEKEIVGEWSKRKIDLGSSKEKSRRW